MMQTKQMSPQRGFTLIEVMVVFFVLSVGLLGMAALQMRSMQYGQEAFMRSQATVAAYDMLDRMRLNRKVAVVDEGYDVAYGVTAAPGGGAIETADVLEWTTFLANTLPAGQGQIACNPVDSQCTVSIQWTNRVTGVANNTAAEPPLSVTVQM